MAEDKILQLVVKGLKKRLGDRTHVSVMGDGQFKGEPTEFFSTGVSLLDRAITPVGVTDGGFPIGRLTEIFGDVATGKSLLLLTAIAKAQQKGALCFYLDTERATSRKFAKQLCGVNDETLIHLEPETQEDLWDAVMHILTEAREASEDRPILVGIDSLAAVGSRAEKNMTFDDQTAISLAARIIRIAMRRLTTEFSNDRAAVIFTNQEIAKIGAMAFAEKTMSWGGSGPKYHSSVRVKLDQIGWEKVDGERIGAEIRATVYKNRHDPPGRQIEYTIYNRGPIIGIDDVGSVIKFLNKKHRLGTKSGFVEWDGQSMRRSALVERARQDPKLFADLKNEAFKLFDVMGGAADDDEPVSEGA